MKKLENSLKKEEIKKQLREWKTDNFKYSSYYLFNIAKVIFGYEPVYISPKNKIVNSYIHRWD